MDIETTGTVRSFNENKPLQPSLDHSIRVSLKIWKINKCPDFQPIPYEPCSPSSPWKSGGGREREREREGDIERESASGVSSPAARSSERGIRPWGTCSCMENEREVPEPRPSQVPGLGCWQRQAMTSPVASCCPVDLSISRPMVPTGRARKRRKKTQRKHQGFQASWHEMRSWQVVSLLCGWTVEGEELEAEQDAKDAEVYQIVWWLRNHVITKKNETQQCIVNCITVVTNQGTRDAEKPVLFGVFEAATNKQVIPGDAFQRMTPNTGSLSIQSDPKCIFLDTLCQL